MKANIMKHDSQYINLRTGKILSSRRDCVKGLVGLAGILATGQAPAAFVRSMLGARGMAFGGGKKELSYQGSPILWLDGIKNTRSGHVSTSTSWEDLSGFNRDYITSQESGALTSFDFDDVSLVIPNTSFSRIAKCETDFSTSVISFEVYCYVATLKSVILFFGADRNFNSNRGSRWLAFDNETTISTSNKCGWVFPYGVGLHHFYVEFKPIPSVAEGFCTRVVCDGVDLVSKSYSDNWSTQTCSIGYYYAGWMFKNGRLCRIMAHDRALTDDEIASNYAVDKARFNLS